MFEELKGKKLLILGAYSTEIEIIHAAKKLGIYTITTDNHENWDDAPAKYVSDEAWNISWSDLETLKEKCLLEKIDGIMAGFSEKRVYQAELLSRKINKPFYTNGSDLETIINKLDFKQACMNADITVPRRYNIDDSVDFPVIVKPADNGGSRGITICYNHQELQNAYKNALEFSNNNAVVIEQYIVADDVMVFFHVHDGKIELSAMCDRIMQRFDKKITQLPVGYIYPSKYLSIFKNYNLDKFKRLISNLNIKNGLIAFQCFVVGSDVIPFDPTFRLDGTTSYYITERCTGINSLNMLLSYSLTGKMGDDEYISTHENALFKKYCFQLPVLLKNGMIKTIKGLEEAEKIQDVIYIRQSHFVGDELNKTADFSQMLCRIHVVSDSLSELKKDIEMINDMIEVYNEENENMILYQFETDKLLSYYEGN